MPGFPGAAWSSSSSGLCESFHASACSRPPDPTRSTFTGASVLPLQEGLASTRRAYGCGMQEPGLDRHEWESEWASLEEDFEADPFNSLRQVHALITRILKERRILDENLVVKEG